VSLFEQRMTVSRTERCLPRTLLDVSPSTTRPPWLYSRISSSSKSNTFIRGETLEDMIDALVGGHVDGQVEALLLVPLRRR